MVWFIALDTLRLRQVFLRPAIVAVRSAIDRAAAAAGITVLDTCVITHGLRVLVSSSSKSGVRHFTRRLTVLLALQFPDARAAFRGRTRTSRVEPDQVRSFHEYLARCRAAANDAMALKRSVSDRRSALRRGTRCFQAIERANERGFGSEEIAGRTRRYVAAHEAPHDDRSAFAKLCEVIFAQGLGFEVVNKHWTALALAFGNFSPLTVSAVTEERIGTMLAEPAVRDKAKITACIESAKRWVVLAAEGSYLGRVAQLASNDDAADGWPALVRALQEDFRFLRESTARLTLKRWGFFTVKAHPGAHRVLGRLGLVDASAEGPALQRFVGSLAQKLGRDPYAVEASLAIFAGVGPCSDEPRCSDCPLNDQCESAISVSAGR